MTDFSPPPPILVDPTPANAQLAAGIRQTLLGVGAGCTVLGLTHLGAQLNALATVATLLATGISGAVVIWAAIKGQIETRKTAQQKAAMEPFVPDTVAKAKP